MRALAIFLFAARLGLRAGEAPPASIVRIDLGPEAGEARPYAIPCQPSDTVEVDLPAPLEEWAGRGFTPDPERFAGDFAIEASRGRPRLFVTPVAAGAHRILHVVLGELRGPGRSLTLEFLPAPSGLAWTKVTFVAPAAAASSPLRLLPTPPQPSLRQPSAESELGLLRTLRLFANATAGEAAAWAAANPTLQFWAQDGGPRHFGDFNLTLRFALRDTTTGALGLGLSVENTSARRLLFDPASWIVRAGDHVYPAATVDFSHELEAGASAPAFLVIAHGPDGEAMRLLPDQTLETSVAILGEASPRPVQRLALPGLDLP
jgi:hypothetical protein